MKQQWNEGVCGERLCISSGVGDGRRQWGADHALCVELARTVYIRIYTPYIWWFPCQKYRIYTVYIWFWPALPVRVAVRGAGQA